MAGGCVSRFRGSRLQIARTGTITTTSTSGENIAIRRSTPSGPDAVSYSNLRAIAETSAKKSETCSRQGGEQKWARCA